MVLLGSPLLYCLQILWWNSSFVFSILLQATFFPAFFLHIPSLFLLLRPVMFLLSQLLSAFFYTSSERVIYSSNSGIGPKWQTSFNIECKLLLKNLFWSINAINNTSCSTLISHLLSQQINSDLSLTRVQSQDHWQSTQESNAQLTSSSKKMACLFFTTAEICLLLLIL